MRNTSRILLILLFLVGFIYRTQGVQAQEEEFFQIKSSAFDQSSFIPLKHTCQGEDINPALIITGLPEGTKSLALIVDDPDAPMGTWVHWVVFNIPVTERVEENSIPGIQGINDFQKTNYGGPCPPSGVHRYFFKIYALDTMLDLNEGVTKQELEAAMIDHILDNAELIGLYEKISNQSE